MENQCHEPAKPVHEILALRKECAELKAHLACETARLEGVAARALSEGEQQRQEILRLHHVCAVGSGDVHQLDMMEALQELEKLELALVKERQQNAQLLEARELAESSHARDVAMLESMLQQALVKNDKLLHQLAAWEACSQNDNSANDKTITSEQKAAADSIVRARTDIDEPEMEPRRVSVTA